MKNQIMSGAIIGLAIVVVIGFFLWPGLSLGCMGGSDCKNIGIWAAVFIFGAALISIFFIYQLNKSEPQSVQTDVQKKHMIKNSIKIILAIIIVSFFGWYIYNNLFGLRNSAMQVTPSQTISR